jgi:PHD/YefM family antitoxin component YafN of YafNO toxin-antitoxin module
MHKKDTYTSFGDALQSMNNQISTPFFSPSVNNIESARTPMIQARHSRENANILSGGDRIRLENRKRHFVGAIVWI